MQLHSRFSLHCISVFAAAQLVSVIFARNITVFTQTNVSSQYLTDPQLRLPFTTFLYIGPGQDANAQPPATIRISKLPNNSSVPPNFYQGNATTLNATVANSTSGSSPTYTNSSMEATDSTEEAGATILYIQHLANFSIPPAINSPNGLAWHATYIGEVNDTATDAHALMRTWGTGLLVDVWQIVAMEWDKRYWIPFADENTYILKLLDRWAFKDTPGYQSYGKQLNSWKALTEGVGESKSVRVNVMRIDMHDEETGQVYKNDLNAILKEGLEDTKTASIQRVNFLDMAENPNAYVPKSLSPSDSASSLHGVRSLSIRGPVSLNTVYETKITFVRQGGLFSTLSVISEETATVLNELVRAVAVAICIVDFVDGNYVGGALGLVGVTFASLFPIFFDNPLGILYGTLIAILFFILPGAFKSAPAPPPTNNNTQIIQYTFFGDSTHTGNEKCAKQYPGCVASYGPGILTLNFKWEWFDAIVFMIWANQGFPMTIPDMAKAFMNATYADQDISNSTSAVAQISCGGKPGSHLIQGPRGGQQWSQGNPYVCSHPTFHLNRSNIILPRINRSAADVYNDIIDKDGGSCKIVDNSDNPITVPDYGIQITGLPVAIACGINATVPGLDIVSGSQATVNYTSGSIESMQSSLASSMSSASSSSSASLLTSDTATSQAPDITGVSSTTPSQTSPRISQSQTTTTSTISLLPAESAAPSGWSPGSQNTDGRNGEGWVPPPPPTPFAFSMNPSNAACFDTAYVQNFCLPNGTYDYQTGTVSNFNSHQMVGVSFPPGSSIIVRYYMKPNSRAAYVQKQDTFTANQTDNIHSQFSQDMAGMQGLSFDVLIPTVAPPPLACVFTKTNYEGDVSCYGLGANNLTQGAGQVKSVRIIGGAGVTLYPHRYGDPGGLAFTVNVPDVSTIPYGTNSNFTGLISGLWVQQNITYIT